MPQLAMAARRLSGSPVLPHGRCLLSAMSDMASHTLEKRSINDLLQLAERPAEFRALQLHETLKVGLARCALRLAEMPFGFCKLPSIKHVSEAYVNNFRQVVEYEHRKGVAGLMDEEYHELTRSILNEHRGTMLDVAKGMWEFREDLGLLFGDNLELAEVREDLRLIKDVEASLDEFFTERLTLRLLITHVQKLNQWNPLEKPAGKEMVGVVNVNTQPISSLSRAFVAARFMCMRDFQAAPDLKVNGVMHDEYILSEISRQQHFPYVDTHLFYIFLELVKNAARASIMRAQQDGADLSHVPSISILVPEEQYTWDRERSVKLADKGTGMSRGTLSRAFCYSFSSVKDRPTVAHELSDFDRRVPLAGFGFGLPISRVMARYFCGDIDLNSIPGQGTDVYVYL
mmetsp:Transcript_71183/g.204116  ORF Transcript_71183/g.204116 Transcript_71183/m.204116 type:complete len:401 (-) Transcript_71183:44-1246(-)